MALKGRVKVFRKGMSWVNLLDMFIKNDAAEKWFEQLRWGNKPTCPKCGLYNVQVSAVHPSMPYRFRSCIERFSVLIGTVMQDIKLSYQVREPLPSTSS